MLAATSYFLVLPEAHPQELYQQFLTVRRRTMREHSASETIATLPNKFRNRWFFASPQRQRARSAREARDGTNDHRLMVGAAEASWRQCVAIKQTMARKPLN